MNKKTDGDTKERIIAAAYRVLGEQGYDKASMKEIAKEAGVAQGLINYYFRSKEELLFALFRQESARFCGQLEEINKMPVSEHFIRDAMRFAMNVVEESPELHRLRFELFAIGLRSAQGRREIADSMQDGRAQAISAMERLPLHDGVNREAVASILVAVLDGLALQLMADDSMDGKAVYDTLADMLGAYMRANGQQR